MAMNPRTFEFEPVVDETPMDWPRFTIGQVVDVSGVPCMIRKVTRKDLILRPVRPADRPGNLHEE